jgi:hypothetical protein
VAARSFVGDVRDADALTGYLCCCGQIVVV